MSGCFQPSGLLTVSAGRAKSGNSTQLPQRFFPLLFSILQLQTVLLVHVHERSTDGQKYFIEQSFFFKIMSSKCVNLSVEQTFSRTSACGRSDTDLLVWERDRTSSEELNRLTQSSLVVLKKEFTSAVTIMPRICHENQPPFCHFVMLTGSALFDECLKWPVFYAKGCLQMFVKLVWGWSSHV